MAHPEAAPEPTRVRQFAHFFKQYMSILAVVAAALPIPVTSVGLIPLYSAQKPYLSTYASLFCFLSLGFLFFSRHALARRMFPALRLPEESVPIREDAPLETHYRLRRSFVPVLPLLLILSAFGFALAYHYYMNESLAAQGTPSGVNAALADTPFNRIPYATALTITYLGIFATAEAAFILMAIKEYLQDLLGVSEVEVITHFRIKDQADLQRLLAYRRGEPQPPEQPQAPSRDT